MHWDKLKSLWNSRSIRIATIALGVSLSIMLSVWAAMMLIVSTSFDNNIRIGSAWEWVFDFVFYLVMGAIYAAFFTFLFLFLSVLRLYFRK